MKNNRNITFDAYVNAVKKSFGENSYTKQEIDEYFNSASVKQMLKEEYEDYTTEDPNDITSGGHDPNAVAYCLDMMY